MLQNQTPAPQEIKVALDDLTLTVPDVSKPLWFGTYFTGKLAIYKAEVTLHDNASQDVVDYISNANVFICTLTETGNEDFMIYSPYEDNVPVDAVCNHLLANVWNAYQGQLQTNNPASYLPAPERVQ